MRAGPISSVAIAGGGIVGWSAAAALKKRIPQLSVTVVPVEPPPDALADRMAPTLPSIVEFHADLGLTEADTVARASSGFRLGTRFEGWVEGIDDYVHAYGEYGRPLGSAAFHQHWLRAAKTGEAGAFDAYSPAAMIGESGHFIHPQGDADSPLSSFAYGLHIDPPRYREMMRAYALHLGVAERFGTIRDVRLCAEDGFVSTLVLDDGGELAADLFVDSTGPAAMVRGRLDQEWEDWSRWLPSDRILFAEAAPPADVPPLDRAIAIPGGWRWTSASPVRTSHGFVYSSQRVSDSKAERVLRNAAAVEASEAVTVRQGRRSEPWLSNCVAIGDAAVAVEPLEWTNLHFAHSAIDRLVAMMPDRDCSAVELWDYNRQTTAESDRVRDFLALHYATARSPANAFWREACTREPPPSLAHTLLQFRERGRLPFYEEETFSRDSWLAVLIGQGVIPRRIDPLIGAVPPEESGRVLNQLHAAIDRLVPTLPSHSDYLRAFHQQAIR